MRTWFITGASRGFGLLFVKKALELGDNVIATARNPKSVMNALGEHSNLLAIPLDVTNAEDAYNAVVTGIAKFGTIDIVINNAGFGLLGAVEESQESDIKPLFETNVYGTLNVIRAVLPQLRIQKSGHIINISSIGGVEAFAGYGVYSATKFAIEGITEALAKEVNPLGIKATVVEPGFFRTDFLDDSSLRRTEVIIEDYKDTVGQVRSAAEQYNHAQPGDPDKLAEAIVKLVNAKEAPIRLGLGSDTIAVTEAKMKSVAVEMEKWKSVSLSTDF
ncbi:TPA: SDR family NAD(P)-dependent oxidoreductase [Klebsiella pneumoniae]|nr:SDR family NAD(P)-dependent oxidoreductase [Klebsiella pneumoniae]